VVAEARPEAVATVPRQAPAATDVKVEAPAEVAQGPAPPGGSRAAVVEIPDDDSPPPGGISGPAPRSPQGPRRGLS
jgi:hypothetical protein